MLLDKYTIESLKAKLYVDIQENKCYLESWKNVTRNRKKDGSDYQNINKNFNGTRIDPRYYIKWLVIHTQNGAHYIEDSVLVEQCKTIEDMFNAISDHIKTLEYTIEAETHDLEKFENIITETCNEMETALNHMDEKIESAKLQFDLTAKLSQVVEYYRV